MISGPSGGTTVTGGIADGELPLIWDLMGVGSLLILSYVS